MKNPKAGAERYTVIITHYGVGGALLYLRQMVSALENRGYHVIVYLPQNTDINIRDNSFCRYVFKEPSINPLFLRPKLLKYLFHLSKYLYNALIFKPERGIKIAHLLFPFYLTDSIMINKLKRKGIKVLLTVHEVFPHRPFLGGKMDKKLIKKMFEDADLLLVHTNTLKDGLLDLFPLSPGKVRVIPHGCSEFPESLSDVITLKKKYHVPSDRKALLFFGTIRENKGLNILLDVMRELKEGYFLLLAGQIAGVSEPQADYYKGIIKTNNIGDSVYWVERFISDEEISEVFKIADAIVLPYRKSFLAQSGVLSLAIGYEKPCVVSDVGGMGETVREYNLGVVVRPDDKDGLKQGIISLFKNKNNFRFDKYKRENSWNNIADKLIAVYRELLGM